MKLKFIILPLLLIAISSCGGKIFSEDNIFAPTPLLQGTPDKDASEEYKKGWDDGCKTGMSMMVNGYYKSFYGFKQDPYMVENPVYYKAWKDSFTYCKQYAFKYTWDAYDKTSNKALDNPLCIICPNENGR